MQEFAAEIRYYRQTLSREVKSDKRRPSTLCDKILGLLLAVVAVCGSALAADEYKIDPNHSSVNFAVTHLMVNTVHGRFTAFEGKILYDEKDITKSSVT